MSTSIYIFRYFYNDNKLSFFAFFIAWQISNNLYGTYLLLLLLTLIIAALGDMLIELIFFIVYIR